MTCYPAQGGKLPHPNRISEEQALSILKGGFEKAEGPAPLRFYIRPGLAVFWWRDDRYWTLETT